MAPILDSISSLLPFLLQFLLLVSFVMIDCSRLPFHVFYFWILFCAIIDYFSLFAQNLGIDNLIVGHQLIWAYTDLPVSICACPFYFCRSFFSSLFLGCQAPLLFYVLLENAWFRGRLGLFRCAPLYLVATVYRLVGLSVRLVT